MWRWPGPLWKPREKRQVRERLLIRIKKIHEREERLVPAEDWGLGKPRFQLKVNRGKNSRHGLTEEVVAMTSGEKKESGMTPEY